MIDEGWQQRARATIRELAASGVRFTADDVLDKVGHPDKAHIGNGRNNQIGSIFQGARAKRMIVAVDVAQSKQPHRKGGMIRVWQGTERYRRPGERSLISDTDT